MARQSEILGLFATPGDVQSALRSQIMSEAQQMYTDPIARQLYTSTAGLAGGIGQAFGMQDQAVAEATRIQDIRKSVDFDPDNVDEYYFKMSKRLMDAGLTKAGAEALKLAQDAKAAKASGAGEDTAAIRQYKFYQTLSPEERIAYDRAQGRTLSPEEARILEQAKTEGRTIGKAEAEATMSLPEVESTIAETQSSVDFLLDEKNRDTVESITGFNSYIPPIRGTAAFDAVRQFEQLIGQLSLSQYEKLKGAGQITEKELEVASNAITKLDRGLSYDAFIAELKKLKGILDKAKERAKGKAGATPVPAQPTQTPKPTMRYNPATGKMEPI